jgi:cyclopropane-fatty-acyl-phospholipid synthase
MFVDEAGARIHPSEEGWAFRGVRGIAKSLLFSAFSGLREGYLEVQDGNETHRFGDEASLLRAHARIRNPKAYELGAFRGEVGLGEAFMQGYWTSPDPVAVVRLAVRNMAAFDRGGGILASFGKFLSRLRHLARANNREGSRANIAAHYDLGNDFYRLFLDESLAYSCAIFETPELDLASAQRAKFDRICQKLSLGPDDHLLEIGTGWGGFALHAAKTRGCRITTTTISRQQHDYAAELFAREGVDDRVTLRFEDYRELQGRYDKVVSIEMFEAVGLKYYDAYFSVVDRLLTGDGLALIQAITMNERRFPAYIRGTDWIQQYIFPGAELASLSEVLKSLGRTGTLTLHHLEDIGIHYAHTLQLWRAAFHARLEQVRALGFDETFLRMWDYYLAYCEGAFRERYIGDSQLLLTKSGTSRAVLDEPWGRP